VFIDSRHQIAGCGVLLPTAVQAEGIAVQVTALAATRAARCC
jgi:hypothetical protein